MRGRDGESLSPRDVLAPDELAAYYRDQDRHPRRGYRRPVEHRRWDELGYSFETGNWDPSKDGERDDR